MGYAAALRRNALALNPQPATLNLAYTHDPAGRLQTVSDGAHTATYDYLENSPLVSQITFATGGQTVMTTSKQHDFLNRLTSIASSGPGFQSVSFAYTYNAANQRIRRTEPDSSYWVYQYDSLGQVISGKRYWPDGTPVAGQQFEYGFDHTCPVREISTSIEMRVRRSKGGFVCKAKGVRFSHGVNNRRSTRAGGDGSGASLRPAFYTNNLLNQITARTVPGYVEVQGTAHAEATVTVWSGTERWAGAERKGTYWRAELPVDNSGGPVWLPLSSVAVLRDGTNPDRLATENGNACAPRTPEAFAHDADGNLTQDGRWSYTWDLAREIEHRDGVCLRNAGPLGIRINRRGDRIISRAEENRLVKVESRSDTPPASRRKVEWQFDALGRRIRQTVSDASSGTWQVAEDLKLVSDPVRFGRHLAELNAANNALVRTYVWGLDLSGTLDGAGGVGGLLWLNSAAHGTHFCASDGNGNIVALIAASDGSKTARYEYGPFGEPLRLTGPMARENPFRFSTKRTDNTTDLVLYEYRPYSPNLGRWPNRDPIEEFGGFNLYGFVGNSPISRVDILGLIPPISATSSLPNRDSINEIAGVSFHWLVQDQPIQHYDAFGRLDGTIGFVYADLRLDRPTSAHPRWPHVQPPLGPSLSAIQICTRDIDKSGANCWDWCILGIANALSRHVYLDYGIDANGKRRGVGYNDPNGKAGSLPRPEDDLDKFPPRHCNSCWKVGRTLQYGSGKGKKGADATDDEIWECLHLAPLLKDYGGLCNNCRHWAYSAAERCGLLCLSY